MIERTPIFLRAHTEVLKNKNPGKKRAAKMSEPKWPKYALVIDTETTTDERQALTFGFYRFCRCDASGTYVCIEEGVVHADDLPESDPDAFSVLQRYIETRQAETPPGYPALKLRSRSEFIEQSFWRTVINSGGFVVGFNLPFDLSRLAVECCTARRRDEGWSLVMSLDKDPKTGQVRRAPFRPWIIVTPKDSKAAFIRLAGVGIRSKKTGRRFKPYTRGRFLDLRMLGWALRNEPFSLQFACEAFGVSGKLDHQPTGRVSIEEMEYARQDVRATVALLNAMRAEFDRHPIDLHPDRAYSPASIAKAYLKAMGVIPPCQKFAVPSWVLGAAMQAYFGGRAECRIRHTAVPVVDTDFMSEYPTVNTLMGLWRLLTAEQLRIEDATEGVRNFIANLSPEAPFDPKFWKQLAFFALVRPAGDILPVRTTYNGDSTNIGVNPLTSDLPVWYAGPDIVASALLTGRAPEIVRAFRVDPEGQQAGLQPVALRGMVEVNPRTDDFFKAVIEARARVKADKGLAEPERKALSYFLKILANAGSYGLFVEVNPDRLSKGTRGRVAVFSGETAFETTSPVMEDRGVWYFPLFAALITAAGRLLLAMVERLVTDAGGTYMLCDTDSMAIVASETGGLIPCAGGPNRLPDGQEAITALSWDEIRGIVREFDRLNPYDRNAEAGHILKIEDVNFHDGAQRQLYGYSIAAKRYALFTQAPDGGIRIAKASAHGLGFLYPPRSGYDSQVDAPCWAVEAWDWILRGTLDLPQKALAWFELPAMMRFTITTPEVLKVLQARQSKLPYQTRVKPFNFIQSPIIDPLGGHPVGSDPDHFTLIAPFTADQSRWRGRLYANVYDGKLYRLARPGEHRLSSEAEPQTYGDVVSRYRLHPEAKSLAPDGNPCGKLTHGLLGRTPVTAGSFLYIGKETDRRWEQGEDISMLNSEAVEYRPNETARLVADPTLQRHARKVSRRSLAKQARVSDRTVRAARNGQRLRKSTIQKLSKALDELLLSSSS